MIPTLTTDRLTLRAPRLTDVPMVQRYFGSPRSHPIGGPLDPETVARNFARGAGNWVLRGIGMWYIDLTATGALIGRTGIYFHDAWPEPELAWTLFDGADEGKGYATEAAAAAITAARRLGVASLISSVTETNLASIAVARKLGAQDEGPYDTPYGPMRKFRHFGRNPGQTGERGAP